MCFISIKIPLFLSDIATELKEIIEDYLHMGGHCLQYDHPRQFSDAQLRPGLFRFLTPFFNSSHTGRSGYSVQLSLTYPRLLWIINIWYRSHLTGTPHLVSVPLSLPPPPLFPGKMRRRLDETAYSEKCPLCQLRRSELM